MAKELQKAVAYAGAALRTMTRDRAMLLTDFVLATSIPYVIQFAIWTNVYNSTRDTSIEGFTKIQTLFYFAYALALGRLNNGYDIIASISEAIHGGRIEVLVTKPIPFPFQKLYAFLGESSLYLIPVIAITFVQAFFLGLSAEWSWYHWPAFVAVIAASQVLCFVISFSLGLIAFWVVKIDVILILLIASSSLLGGALLPPSFWPEPLIPLMTYNPFRYLIGAPAELMVRASPTLFIETAVGLFAWITFFLAFAFCGWRRGMGRYVGAGG